MTVHATSPQFKENARAALADAHLQAALANVRRGFVDRRRAAADRLTRTRDFPAPQGDTFQARWRRERQRRAGA